MVSAYDAPELEWFHLHLLELYYIDYTIWHNAGSITQNTPRFNRFGDVLLPMGA